MAPQMISFVSGSSGLGASWQSSIAPPSSRMWMHSSDGVVDLGLFLLRPRRVGEGEDEADAERSERQQQSLASHDGSLLAHWARKKTTKPISASASTKAMPRNIVVRTMPAASGWRAMAWTD